MSDPYEERYTSKAMQEIFSDEAKFKNWRRLWIAIATAQSSLGLSDDKGNPRITDEMIQEMEANAENLNLDVARKYEEQTKHDVMAHVKAFGDQCPKAKGIIHLGCTSRDITDNCELLMIQQAGGLVLKKLANALGYMANNASLYEVMTLGRTHYQPAQATTVGRRFAMHGEELLLALDELETRFDTLPLRGIKGTVGTQADQLVLFKDSDKVKKLDELIADELEFDTVLQWTGQTYHRMIDYMVASSLGSVAIAARRFANSVRLLQGMEELEEPFAESQVGSSAMPWKRNPKNCERMSSLSYAVIGAAHELGEMAANQWLEGSVEDSALRRIKLREAFYATDGILELYIDTLIGLHVYECMIEAHVEDKLPLIATNTFLMEAVKRGGDRQVLHEVFREHAQESVKVYRATGKMTFLDKISSDERIPLSAEDVANIVTDSSLFVGRAVEQTDDFVSLVDKRLMQYKNELGYKPEVKV